jgi:hypothetical protein
MCRIDDADVVGVTILRLMFAMAELLTRSFLECDVLKKTRCKVKCYMSGVCADSQSKVNSFS